MTLDQHPVTLRTLVDLLLRDPLSVWDKAVRLHPEIQAAFVVSQIAGLVAFLAALTAMEAPQLGASGSVIVTLLMGTATGLAMMALRRGMHPCLA